MSGYPRGHFTPKAAKTKQLLVMVVVIGYYSVKGEGVND